MIPNDDMTAKPAPDNKSPEPAKAKPRKSEQTPKPKATASPEPTVQYIGPQCNHSIVLTDGTIIPAHRLKDEAYIRRLAKDKPRIKKYFTGLK